jgi:ABC-type Fe3+/spermidine/putrescine transport system ATPase subunit
MNTSTSSTALAPALSVQALSLALGGRPVLQGIDLCLERGQTLALLGPSGCGKTSLLRVIAGLVTAAAGQVRIGGQVVDHLPPQARGVGMMFQSYALFPNLSVRDNIAFGPLAQGWGPSRAQARTDELLDLVDLRAHAGQRPAQLSGGQRQRAAMARALAAQPALLLMDEPFSAIDEAFRLPLRRAFRQLQRSLSQSCVMVTHDREEAFELADVVAVMLDGRLARIGTPEALLRDPGSVAVARFLGAANLYHQGPAGLAATGLCQAAPITTLRLCTPADTGGWRFDAVVTARHAGLRGTQLDLRTDDGHALQLIVHGLAPEMGDRCRLLQPIEDLVTLLH